MHRLETPVQVAAIDDLGQSPDDVGLELKIHRQVRVGPIPEYPHAHKVRFLRLDLLTRVFTTVLPELSRCDFVAGLTDFLLDIQLDG